MPYHYRTAAAADLRQLALLGLNAYGSFKETLTATNWDKLYRYLTAENTYKDLLSRSVCFVCEKDDHITGMAFLIPSGNPTDIFPPDWCYLRMVGVHTDHSGNGIGKTLTQMCIDRAIANREKIIGLHTSEFMDAARHIYEKMGFFQVKQLEQRLGKTYWLYARHL